MEECSSYDQDKRTIIVANAEPYEHVFDEEGEVSQKKVPGGLTTGLDPLMSDSENLWIAWGRGEADFEVTDKDQKISVPDEDGYTLKRVKLSKKEKEGYYYGFANETLWPLCHSFPERTRFDRENWKTYKKVNKKFAKSVMDELEENDRVWIHDYHLTLVPKMIKEENPEAEIGLFWHIPWPPWEIFGILPSRKDIMTGMMSADFIGFHTPWLVHNFFDTVSKLGGAVKAHNNLASIDDEQAVVKDIPFGIDCEAYTPTEKQRKEAEELRNSFSSEKLILSLDRLDYTKGIDKRLDAIRRFFQKHPEYLGKVTFIQRVTPSRDEVTEYQDIKENIERQVANINGEFQKEDWVPIRYFYQYLPQEKLIKYYLASDIALITPLIDGMNLVSKEFVCSKEKGVLILSEFAGAAESLNEAIQVNPNNPDEVSDAIYEALNYPEEKKRRLFQRMSEKIERMDINWWRNKFLEEWELSYHQSKEGFTW